MQVTVESKEDNFIHKEANKAKCLRLTEQGKLVSVNKVRGLPPIVIGGHKYLTSRCLEFRAQFQAVGSMVL